MAKIGFPRSRSLFRVAKSFARCRCPAAPWIFKFVVIALSWTFAPTVLAAPATHNAGLAQVDITPSYPIRLSGYGSRRTESEGVAQRLWAKALAIGNRPEELAILVTVDNCGVPATVRDELVRRLGKEGVAGERVALCSTHTHTGPCLSGVLPNLFSSPIPKEQQATIDRYASELTDKLEAVCVSALRARAPSVLAWTQGSVGFARNRRTQDGPVDHALPMLSVRAPDGKLRGLLVNYACHGTTLYGELNQHHGDWPGAAQEFLQRDFPGAIAMVAIGCGADANPHPRSQLAHAQQHGEAIATEVRRLLDLPFSPLPSTLECRAQRIELPFQPLPSRAQWEERAQRPGIVGHHARVNLERLDRGETLPTTLPYLIQTWNFGTNLAMVFLPGEVVVDYSLRLKREWDSERLWVNGYANDVPCYIPSRRILAEGGYEAEDSLWYYDRPARLAPETEDLIHATIHGLLPKAFLFDRKRAEFPLPKSPEEALATFQVHQDFTVEIAAAEPQVVDPVAIDFGPDGRLWVVEMRDFPLGMDGNWKPGGRVKFLNDRDGDGRFEESTVFLENVPFPTGIMAWSNGVLICAAPDILYAEDTNGDGRADVVKKLFSGFATDNYQARVNSLSLGLDHWIYGANGLIGGAIQSFAGGPPVNIRGRDFRCDPLTGVFEPASGLTQQGRVRDDWGNWFGCDNSTLLWFYPLADHYVRRNPHAAPPELRVPLVVEPDGNLIHPISRTLERFNDPGHANRVTSACGLGLYRDVLLGDAFYNNAFICEPVHNLVHRRVLSNQGVTFAANRASEERESEFLASKDNWFRPVQARTGRDGALWIVDMYRFVVEHPRWITPDRLAELDLRAGQDKGRIYRIRPRTQPPRPVRNLTELPAADLARALDHPNGTERDLIHLELLRRKDSAAIAPLRNLAASNARPIARLQALAVLDGLNALPEALLLTMLHDSDAGVREQAVRISERFKPSDPLIESLLALIPDSNPRVRFQLALSLGNRTGSRITSALATLARSPAEPWIAAAVISSASDQPGILLESLLARPVRGTVSNALISKLAATAIGTGQPEQIQAVLRAVAPSNPARPEPWEAAALEELLRAAQPTGTSPATLAGNDAGSRAAVQRIDQTLELQRRIASNPNADEPARNGAVRLLGFQPVHEPEDAQLLLSLLRQTPSDELRKSIFRALERLKAPGVASELLGLWPQLPPSLRARTIDLLLRREAWLDALLGGVENGGIQPAEFAPGQRQALLKNPRVASRAEPLFRPPSASRSQVVEQFSAALRLAGDAIRGAEQFRQLCANCHVWRDQGVAVGPNLATLTDRTPQFLLTAILDPNAAVENRYLNYQVDLTDGRSLSGIISAESSSSLTLLTSGAAAETLLRSSIAGLRASHLSLMPEGLEQGRTAQDLADLIAYLKL